MGALEGEDVGWFGVKRVDGAAGVDAAPVAGEFEDEGHAGGGVVEEGADFEELAQLEEGEGGGFDGLPEGGFEGGVIGEFDFEGCEGAGDGLFAGELGSAGFGGGLLFDDEAGAVHGGCVGGLGAGLADGD